MPRWQLVTGDADPGNIDDLYPGGDDDAALAQLMSVIRGSELPFEETENGARFEYENGVAVYVQVFRGDAWIYAFSGGMPGETDEARGEAAIELLKRNWNDELGHLSLDGDNDVLWECQVPVDYLTLTYLERSTWTAANEVFGVSEQFGFVAFNG